MDVSVIGVPTGIRTPVASVKGMCPRPLDDGDAGLKNRSSRLENWWSQAGSNRRPLACHASALPAELWPHRRRGTLPDRGQFVKKMNELRAPGDSCAAQSGQRLDFTQNRQCG